MNDLTIPTNIDAPKSMARRKAINAFAMLSAAAAFPAAGRIAFAQDEKMKGKPSMSPKAFVYTEVQVSVADFDKAPWREMNPVLLKQPGLLSKNWLWDVGSHAVGGFYSFDSIANAEAFVTGYFPTEARSLGATHNTRVFDAAATAEASEGMKSVHYGARGAAEPGAFVYTEVQINLPFEKAPWKDRNQALWQTKGLLGKTWLSGLHTHTLGGLDAFDTVENAKAFAINEFPKTAAKLNAAFTTRVFDARATKDASIQMRSPFYV